MQNPGSSSLSPSSAAVKIGAALQRRAVEKNSPVEAPLRLYQRGSSLLPTTASALR